jgi:hypothetical protein
MRKPVGVIVAAVILGLMTAIGLLGAVVQLGAVLFVHSPLLPPGHLGQQIHFFLVLSDAIFFCILLFCGATAIELLRMRPWARYAVIVIGAGLAIVFGALSGLTLYLSKFVRGSMAAVSGSATLSHPGAFFVGLSLFYAAVACVGIWWIVYFSLGRVREAFASVRQYEQGVAEGTVVPVEAEYGFWRVVVIVMALLMLVGGAFLIASALSHMPSYFFGSMIQGVPAMLIQLLMAAVQLFIGVGLLRRNQAAYWTAIAWQVYGLLSTAFLFSPAARERLLSYQSQVSHSVAPAGPNAMVAGSAPSLGEPFLAMIAAVACLVFLFFLFALLRTKHWYAPSVED